MPSQPAGKNRGFTLVELIFVIAIAAILCAISLPALGNLMQSSQSRSAHNQLITALNLARSTAVARGGEVVLCPSTDQQNCDEKSLWWQHGWIAFQDLDRNGKRNGNESVLAVAQPQPGVAIASSTGREHVTYRVDGSATGTNLTFTLCDRRGTAYAGTIVVSNSGRPRQGPATKAQATAACAGLQ
jgi:type IV fimbrial biogenesis protein FimT